MMDYTGYQIYIPKAGGAVVPLEKNRDHSRLGQDTIFNFKEGIKKLQEEKWSIYLPTDLPREEVEEFIKVYGILAV